MSLFISIKTHEFINGIIFAYNFITIFIYFHPEIAYDYPAQIIITRGKGIFYRIVNIIVHIKVI